MPGTVVVPRDSGVTVHMRLCAIWDVIKMDSLLVEQMEMREDDL